MTDVLEVDAFGNGAWIIRFDGRVLQIFGCMEIHTGTHAMLVDSWSIHVRHLTVHLFGPSRKGTHDIAFTSLASAAGCPDRGILKLTELGDALWARMQPLVAAVRTAGANVLISP